MRFLTKLRVEIRLGLNELKSIAIRIAAEQGAPPRPAEGIGHSRIIEFLAQHIQLADGKCTMPIAPAVRRTAYHRIGIRQLKQMQLLSAGNNKPSTGITEIGTRRIDAHAEYLVIEAERALGIGDDHARVLQCQIVIHRRYCIHSNGDWQKMPRPPVGCALRTDLLIGAQGAPYEQSSTIRDSCHALMPRRKDKTCGAFQRIRI